MPLAPALLARLRKRGIVQRVEPPPKEQIEEVIAEAYDPLEREQQAQEVPEQFLTYEIPNCPNTDNPFHSCVDFCGQRWGVRSFKEEPEIKRKRQRLLKRYPTPEGWHEVADPDTGRFYYWNESTDKVSWLPPQHPRARITISAEKLQQMIKGGMVQQRADDSPDASGSDSDGEADNRTTDDDMDDDRLDSRRHVESSDDEGQSKSIDGEEIRPREDDSMDVGYDFHNQQQEDWQHQQQDWSHPYDPDTHLADMHPPGTDMPPPVSQPPRRGGRRERGEKRRSRFSDKEDTVDPMDPASYSEVSPGGWNAGLETEGSAKTGVDSTASGPLFQQRPYPSPGAVLRANQAKKQ